MATYSASEVEDLTDRLGATWAALVATGASSDADDVRTGAASLVADLEALSLAKGLVMGPGANTLVAAVADIEGQVASVFATVVRALNSDLGGFSSFANTNSIMYSSDFRDLCAELGITIAATYVYKMTNQTLATVTITGATTLTFSGTGTVDTSLYGAMPCEVLITNDIDSATTLNLTMVKADATTEIKTVNLTTSDDTGETVAIGTDSDRYVDCSGATVSGGTNADAVTVRTKVLRTPTVS